LKFLLQAEERMEIEQAELEFKQQVRLSAMNLVMPDLWDRLFTPAYVPSSEVEDIQEGVFFPTTPEEFEAMAEEFEAGKIEQEIRGTFTQES
jgi:hypothetical protein